MSKASNSLKSAEGTPPVDPQVLHYNKRLGQAIRNEDIGKGVQLLVDAAGEKVPLELPVVNTLLASAARSRDATAVPRILEAMSSLNLKWSLYTYSILLSQAARKQDIDGFEKLWAKMMAAHPDKTMLNVYPFNAAIQCYKLAPFQKMQSIIAEMDALRIPKSEVTYRLLFQYFDVHKHKEAFLNTYYEFSRRWRQKEIQPESSTVRLAARICVDIHRRDLLHSLVNDLILSSEGSLGNWEAIVPVAARAGEVGLLERVFAALVKNTFAPSPECLAAYASVFPVLANMNHRPFEPSTLAVQLTQGLEADEDITILSDEEVAENASFEKKELIAISERRVQKFIAAAEKLDVPITSEMWNNILYFLARMRCFQRFAEVLANLQDKDAKGEAGFRFELGFAGYAGAVIASANNSAWDLERKNRSMAVFEQKIVGLPAPIDPGRLVGKSNAFRALIYGHCLLKNPTHVARVLGLMKEAGMEITQARGLTLFFRDLQNDLAAIEVLIYAVKKFNPNLLQDRRSADYLIGAYLFRAAMDGVIDLAQSDPTEARKFMAAALAKVSAALNTPPASSLFVEIARMFALRHNLPATEEILTMLKEHQQNGLIGDPKSPENAGAELIAWNLRIVAASATKSIDRALDLVKEMKKSGLKPDLTCYTPIIRSCRNQPLRVFPIYNEMIAEGIRPDKTIFTYMMLCFTGPGHLQRRERVKDEMVKYLQR